MFCYRLKTTVLRVIDDSLMNFIAMPYTEDSSILGAGDMSFHVVMEEGPSEEVLAHNDGIKNVNSGSNVYENLGKT